MAGPLAGISAAQIAQQKLPEAAQQQANKAGPSKFDQAMKANGPEQANKADAVNKAQQVQHAELAQKINNAKQVDQVGKVDKAAVNKVTDKGMDPVAQKKELSSTGGTISNLIGGLEKHGSAMDKLLDGTLSTKNMSNGDLLKLQAGMYKYSQEIDLCSKVVEKATSGLKDTLKTQV